MRAPSGPEQGAYLARQELSRSELGIQNKLPRPHSYRLVVVGTDASSPARRTMASARSLASARSAASSTVDTLPSAERYGLIWVCLEDTPRYPLGEFPQYDDPTYRKMHLTTPDWSCSAPRRVENYSDLAHFAFVHDGVLGDINDPSIKPHDVTRDEHTLTLSMTEPIWAGSMKNRAMTNPVPAISHWKLFMPLTILLTVTSGEEQYCLFFHPTPLGAKKTRNFTIAARNYGDPTDDYSKFQEFQDLVYEQDREIVESQRPEELPEDLSFEMHLKGVDTLSITYRRWLKELADELASS